MKCRRSTLDSLSCPPTVHVGLWLDRYLREQTEEGCSRGAGEKAALIREVVGRPCPEGYREAFLRRRSDLETRGAVLCEARVLGRMVVGLGARGSLEAGLRIEHTWGVPVIPGSTLKGRAAASADHLLESEEWRKGSGASHRRLFGTTDEEGGVVFHDAWWIPPEDPKAVIPIHQDVMTVHHPDYYQHEGRGERPPPSDMDSPNPIAFASTSGSYLVAVEGEPELCDAALRILKIGLAELGIGAKTMSGYGRLELLYTDIDERRARDARRAEEERAAQAKREEEAKQRLAGAIAGIANNTADTHVPRYLKELSGEERRAFAKGAIERLTRKWLKDPKRKQKPWYKELFEAAGEEPPA